VRAILQSGESIQRTFVRETRTQVSLFAGATTNCSLKEANLEYIQVPSYEESLVSLGMRFFRKSIGGAGLLAVLTMKLRAGFDAPYPMDKLILRRVLGGRLVQSIESRMRSQIVHMLQKAGPAVPGFMANLQVAFVDSLCLLLFQIAFYVFRHCIRS
jgi:hypothetical protein